MQTQAERVTLVYKIKIDLPNEKHELKPGMPADAVVDLLAPAAGANAEKSGHGMPALAYVEQAVDSKRSRRQGEQK